MASRNWLGTYNNPTDIPHEYLEKGFNTLKAKYVCGQLEKGENGTPHVQFFVNLNPPQRLSALVKAFPGSHFEKVKINNGAHDYCMKEDSRIEGPWQFGEKPVQRNNKTDWQRVKDQAVNGDFNDIDPHVLIQHYNNLRRIHTDLSPQTNAVRAEARTALWYWGPTGTGKTRKAHQDHPDHFQKLPSKWWCGY